MPTNGISIPDEDKVQIKPGEEDCEETWIELTNHRGDEDE